MKEFIQLKLILISLAIFIAYQLARFGKKRLIGFKWSFYFSILNPIFGLIMVFTSKKQGAPVKSTHILVKILAVILIAIGTFYFLSNITSLDYLNANQTERLNSEKSEFNFFEESAQGIGRLIGGGILTIFVSSESYENMDYKAKRSFSFMVSFIYISLGIFLLRKKKGFSNIHEQLTE